MAQIADIESSVKIKLHDALKRHYFHENQKAGFILKTAQINDLCRILLTGNEAKKNEFFSWRAHEKSLFDEYYKKELEIMDYLHLIDHEMRKQWGQYPTPVGIVRHILKSVDYSPAKKILTRRLIDPACGSGVFVVEATRLYLQALKRSRIPVSSWYSMISSAICGVDVDQNACFFARLNLAMLLASYIIQFASKKGVEELPALPIYCADTLEILALEKKEAPLLYDQSYIPLYRKFDYVVGNPPYFKIKDLKPSIKDAFAESIYGHPNAYALFIQAGIDMMKPGGRMGYIVPRSMLSGLYFKNIRKFVESKTTVREITHITDRKKIFDNVLHGTMILSLQEGNRADCRVDVSFADSIEEITSMPRSINIDQNKVIQHLNGTTVWFVAEAVKIYNIIDRIIKEHPLLSEVKCAAKTGQIVWNRVKPLLMGQKSREALPLVWATDVSKFGFSFNRVGPGRPSFLKLNEKTENLLVHGPTILVQRITADEQPSRIVACMPEEFYEKERKGYFVENHLNIIQSEIERSTSYLYFILGVLNSDIVEFFFRAMNGNTQVSATELNLLPMPAGEYERGIADIAIKIQKMEQDKRRRDLVTDLNMLVAEAYGLSVSELEFVQKHLAARFEGVR